MKFMLMMSCKEDANSGGNSIVNWPKKDIEAHIQFMMDLNARLKQRGEFIDAQGLAWPKEATLVRAGRNGAPVTDGVFPESKEFLIGFWIVETETRDRAYQIAAEASAAPGINGEPLNIPIEVRQVLPAPRPE